jgi:adenylate kinase family enzyme
LEYEREGEMKKAIIIRGPSGVGKTYLSRKISRKYDYKHCDTDSFKLIFSNVRTPIRSKIAGKVTNFYAKELIKEGFDIIIEALSETHINKLMPILKRNNYKIIEISLTAPLKVCIKNDLKRTDRKFGKKVIEEAYKL